MLKRIWPYQSGRSTIELETPYTPAEVAAWQIIVIMADQAATTIPQTISCGGDCILRYENTGGVRRLCEGAGVDAADVVFEGFASWLACAAGMPLGTFKMLEERNALSRMGWRVVRWRAL